MIFHRLAGVGLVMGLRGKVQNIRGQALSRFGAGRY
jgi:hypothetical protein